MPATPAPLDFVRSFRLAIDPPLRSVSFFFIQVPKSPLSGDWPAKKSRFGGLKAALIEL
jgi:hypothetical protein